MTDSKEKTQYQNPVYAWIRRYVGLLYLMAVSLIIALFAFGGSPFYPINEWSDPNCFLTVGRAMLDGKVMYRDIYEQKGPYVYFLHALAALISDTSFIGVWLMEVVTLFFSMWLISKIVGMYGQKQSVCFAVATSIGVSVAFSHAMSTGDSVEEFTSPLYLWLLYVTVKNIKEGRNFSIRQYLGIGITAGVVFWSKFSLIGIYLGWFVYFVWRSVFHKRYREIGKAVLWITCGILLATLPCLVYFLVTGAVRDCLQVYLYDNLFLYSPKSALWKSVLMPFRTAILSIALNLQYNLFVLFGVIWFAAKKKGEERCFLLWTFSLMAVLIFIGGKTYRYYGLPLYVFAVFGYISVIEILEKHGAKLLRPLGAVCGALLLASSASVFFLDGHHHHIFVPREELAQYKVATYMYERSEQPTLLNYGGLDNGFYLASGLVPHLRYFAQLNISLEDMHTEMARYLDEGLTEFVIYCLRDDGEELSHENYQEALRISEWSREERVTYILYQRVSNLSN